MVVGGVGKSGAELGYEVILKCFSISKLAGIQAGGRWKIIILNLLFTAEPISQSPF